MSSTKNLVVDFLRINIINSQRRCLWPSLSHVSVSPLSSGERLHNKNRESVRTFFKRKAKHFKDYMNESYDHQIVRLYERMSATEFPSILTPNL